MRLTYSFVHQLKDKLVTRPQHHRPGHNPDDLVKTLLPGRSILRPTPGQENQNMEHLLQDMMAKRAAARFKKDRERADGKNTRPTLRMAAKHVITTNRLVRVFGAAPGGGAKIQPERSRLVLFAPDSRKYLAEDEQS
jgi:hypothetical protein